MSCTCYNVPHLRAQTFWYFYYKYTKSKNISPKTVIKNIFIIFHNSSDNGTGILVYSFQSGLGCFRIGKFLSVQNVRDNRLYETS